ncbi:MAG: MFS transporter [Pseudomonadota bacterium]
MDEAGQSTPAGARSGTQSPGKKNRDINPAIPKPHHIDDPGRTRYGVGVSVYFGALFLIYGVFLPYFPVWLDWRGLTAEDIAIITALPFFVRFLASPAIALAADRHSTHRLTTVVLSWMALTAGLALTQLTTFWPIAVAALVLSLAKTSVMPMIETLAVTGVTKLRLDYGWMRLWGSLTFILASFVGGLLIERLGSGVTIWLVVVACIVTVLASHLLVKPDATPLSARLPAAAPQPEAAKPTNAAATTTLGTISSALGLLTMTPFLLLLVATGAVQATHATYYTFGTLHWLSQGISPLQAGILWAIGVIAEIIVFAKAGPIIARIGAERLLLAGCLAAVVRWALTATDPGFWALLPIQMLHGLTFGASHVAAIYLVGRMVPPNLQGTGQALHASIGMGLAMGGAMLVSGLLYTQFAGLTYLAMAALGVVASVAAVILLYLIAKDHSQASP